MTLAMRDDEATPNGFTRDLQQYRPAAPAHPGHAGSYAAPRPNPANGQMSLTDWAEQMAAAGQLAAGLARTSFVPESFRGNVGESAAAILTGYEMGLSPTAALRAIYVIKGTPAMYAKAMKAVLLSKGHEVWTVEASSQRVVVKGRRKGGTKEEISIWDMARVKTAGLTSNTQYSKNPQNMLTARAIAEACWLTAPDALFGIGAAVEELGEDPAGEYGETESPAADSSAPAKRTAKRKPLERMDGAEPTPEPVRATAEVGEVGGSEPVSGPPATTEGITGPQMSKMQILLKAKGIDDRQARLDYVASAIGREVASSKDLTKSEATTVIDSLTDLPDLPADEPGDDGQPLGGES